MRESIRKDIGFLVMLGIMAGVVNYPILLGKTPFDFDNLAFYHPIFSLANIRPLVLWDTFQFSGFPIFAEPQYGMFYPLRWIFHYWDVYTGMGLFFILHNVLGIVFMYYFLRSLSIGRVGSSAGTMSYLFGSYWQGKMMMTYSLFFSMPWIPLFLLFAIRAIGRESRRDAIYAGWVLGILGFIGSPHHIFYPCLVVGIYLLFRLVKKIRYKERFKSSIHLILIYVGMVVIGFGIGALQYIPTGELYELSYRAHLTLAQITETPMRVDWIAGSILGGTQTGEFLDASAFFGVCSFLLIVLCLIDKGAREKKLWFWLLFIPLAILIARGKEGFIYPLFYYIPFLKSLSFPCRSLLLVAVSGSILTGYGIDHVLGMKEIKKIHYLVLGTFLMVSIAGLLWLYNLAGMNVVQSVLSTKWANAYLYRWSHLYVFTILICFPTLLYWKKKISIHVFSVLILGIVLMDLMHFIPRLHANYLSAKEYLETPESVKYVQGQIKEPMRVVGYEASRMYSTDQQDTRFKEYLTPKLGDLYRLQDIQGYDPMMLYKYTKFIESMAGRADTDDPQRTITLGTCEPRLLNLLNVGYVIGEVNEHCLWKGQEVLQEGESKRFTIDSGRLCEEIGLISMLDNHLNTPQGAMVGSIMITGVNGEREELPIRAGIESADWRRGGIPGAHEKLKPAMQWTSFVNGEEYVFQNYYTRIKFSHPMVPKAIEIKHVEMPGVLVLKVVTLVQKNDDSLFERVHEDGEMRVYRNKGIFPRAFLVNKVVRVPEEKVLETISNATTDLRNAAYLSETLPVSPDTGKEIGDVKITHYSSGEIEMSSQSKQKSFLVLGEIDYPGWQAWVDEKKVKIYSTDYVLRGIFLEKGNHTIRFVYRPISLYWGFIITILTFGLSIVLLRISPSARREQFPE